MSVKRFRPAAWLEDIIDRDYGPVIHELVTSKFKKVLKKFKPVKSHYFNVEYLKKCTSLAGSDYSSAGSGRASQLSGNCEGSLYGIDFGRAFSESTVSNTIEEVSSRASSAVSFNQSFIPDKFRGAKEELHGSSFDHALWTEPINLNRTHSISEKDHSLSSREVSDLVSLSSYQGSTESLFQEKQPKPNTKQPSQDISIYEDTINMIYKQERIIQTVEHMMTVGGKNKGYVGSVPHIVGAKRLLIANLNKQAYTASLAKSYYFPTTENLNVPKGQVIISNLLLDTDHVGQYGIPPCLYMVTVQHDTTILHTEVQPPDVYGIVKFEKPIVLENVSQDFTLQLSLYKMVLLPRTGYHPLRNMIQRSRNAEVPKLQLIGQKQVSMSNIENTAFSFDNETLYANCRISVETGRKSTRVPMTVRKYVRKNKLQLKPVSNHRWGQLEGTNFKIYKGLTAAMFSEPDEVVDLLKCKSCRTDFSSKNTLIVEYEKSQSSSVMYLTFNDNKTYKEWMIALNAAMAIGKKWKPSSY